MSRVAIRAEAHTQRRARVSFERFSRGCRVLTSLSFANNRSGKNLLRSNAFIPVMEAAELWNCDNFSHLLYLPKKRTLLAQA